MSEFVPDPASGRLFTTRRTARTTDVTPSGRLRLDAVARYLQEAAEDDVTDAGSDEPYYWLLRRSALSLRGYPRLGEEIVLRTFCSATGPRWAERTTTLAGPDGDVIQARAIWVAVARRTGAPAPLSEQFHAVYGASAQGRKVSARLFHPAPGPALTGRPWPLRSCDFDMAKHVNNTVHWMAAEDALAGSPWLPASAEIEYPRPILPGCEPSLVTEPSDGHLNLWLTAAGDVLASARLAR
jgi:acyl-ACP thioesterase